MFLFIISFLAGVLTVLAPCTLPLLPVIVGSSVGDTGDEKFNLRKALTITLSLGASVLIFTLLLKASTAFVNIPQTVWQIVSGVIILIFGLISLFPALWERLPFVAKLNVDSNKVLATGYKKNNFVGNMIIGASLGPVFSTCSPTYFVILATVLPQSFIAGFFDLIAYALGLSGVLLLVALVGQRLTSKLGGISDTHGWFKRGLGALFIIIGIVVIIGLDKKWEADLLNLGTPDITKVEQKLLSLNEGQSDSPSILDENAPLDVAATSTATSSTPAKIADKSKYKTAPEIVNPSGFVNTDGKPITIGQFKGKKVVLLDIWTYSCINCQRTLPYIKEWYTKYEDQGLVIIGIHTPEFAFEHLQSNVEEAVQKLGIKYPVVLDNDYATWNAYGNQYWPRKYLIDVDGKIVYDHIGEGNYDETERAIQKALVELHQRTGMTGAVPTTVAKPSDAIGGDMSKIGSPETYFGAARNQYLANGVPGMTGEQTFAFPAEMKKNGLYLDGKWNIGAESAVAEGVAKVSFKYEAKNIYMVASSDASNGTTVTILRDGVFYKTLTIKDETLYELIDGSDYADHTIEIDIPKEGLKAFTFTFG